MSITPIKGNNNENKFKETPKSRICRSNSLKKSLTTPSDDKKGSKVIPPEELKRVESEIEARLRLKLKVEYSQRYHIIQDQYDQEMMSSSINMSSSFIDNYSIASSSQSYLNYRSSESQSEIEFQKQKYQEQMNEKQRNIQMLDNIKNELTELLTIQEHLQDEQRVLSAQIGEAYSRNSDLVIELSKLREKNNKEIKMDDSMSLAFSPPLEEEKKVHLDSTPKENSKLETTEKDEAKSIESSNGGARNDPKAILSPFTNGKDSKMATIWRKSPLFSPNV